MSTAGVIDIRTGKKTALFKGLTGAVSDLITAPTPKFDDDDDETKERFVASVSLDRFLRVHETSTNYRRVVNKGYLKQRLTCILVDESYEYPVPKTKTEEEELDEEEDAMWESMEVANDKKRKRS
jgi:ribosome biogenesis protein NSA1